MAVATHHVASKVASAAARVKDVAPHVGKRQKKKEIISDDGETVYRPDATPDGHSPASPEVDETAARVQVYDDGEVVYRANPSDSESDEGLDSGELTPQKKEKAGAQSPRADPDDDTIIRRPVADDDDPEVVRIPSPENDPEVIIRHDVSDDPEVVIRDDVSDDPEVVIHHDSYDPEVVIRDDVNDDPEVVIRRDVSDDPEVVIRPTADDDPEVVIRDVDPSDDPEVVHLQPNAQVHRTSDRSDDSEAQRRISPRRRKQQREKVELVSLRVPFKNCESSIAETLWLRILSYLLPRDLCALALVSKEMKRLAEDDDLWSHFALSRHGYTTKPESRGWKEVYGMRNKFVEENRIRARRENFAIVDGRIVDVIAVKSVEKGRQGLVTYITGFDVFTDVLLEGKLGTSFVPVVLAKEECSLVALLPDNKMKLLAANGEKTVPRPASLTPEMASSFSSGAKYAVELLSGMGRERALRVYPRQ